jgi:hypothetical protein
MSGDLADLARSIIDANLYLTLGTVDRDGRPWVSPVCFATADYVEFYWVSDPGSVHSRNLADRSQVSMVIFDSGVPAYTGRAAYLVGEAVELSGSDLDRGLAIYPGRPERGAGSLAREDVVPPAPYRLYRASVSAHFVSCPRDTGRPCALHGISVDQRASVSGFRAPA